MIATQATETLGNLNSGLTTSLRAIQIMLFLGVLGTIAVTWNALRTFSTPGRGWMARLVETTALLAVVGFVWILFNWNLLRPDLRF